MRALFKASLLVAGGRYIERRKLHRSAEGAFQLVDYCATSKAATKTKAEQSLQSGVLHNDRLRAEVVIRYLIGCR